jgi:hypothetical protein
MPSALTRARLVSDKQLDLDKHRGMAEQKATDIRRILHDVEWRVRKRHVRRTSLPPRDRCICGRVGRCERSSKSQHAGVKVETGTFPVAPTRCAASRATTPVPHATSNTRSPGRGSASATTSGAQGAETAGTRACSYVSGISSYLPLSLVSHRPFLASNQLWRLPSSHSLNLNSAAQL